MRLQQEHSALGEWHRPTATCKGKLTSHRRNSRIDRPCLSHDGVLDFEVKHAIARVDVPDLGRPVARTRDEELTIAREFERVDFLIVTAKKVPNALLGNIPDPNLTVLGAGSEVLAVWTEADGANVQVARGSSSIINEHTKDDQGDEGISAEDSPSLVCDSPSLESRLGFVNLSGSVATGGDVLTIGGEADAADDT